MSVILDNPLAKKIFGLLVFRHYKIVQWCIGTLTRPWIPSCRNTVGHLYFAKVLAVIKNVLSVDLKGVFESLNIIFKTSYHMGILMQIKIYRSKNLALISSEKHWPDTNNTNHEVNIPAIKIVDAIPDSYCPFHTPGK